MGETKFTPEVQDGIVEMEPSSIELPSRIVHTLEVELHLAVSSEKEAERVVKELVIFWVPYFPHEPMIGPGPDGFTKITFEFNLEAQNVGEAILEMLRLAELIGLGWTVYHPFSHYTLEMVRKDESPSSIFRIPEIKWCRLLLEVEED